MNAKTVIAVNGLTKHFPVKGGFFRGTDAVVRAGLGDACAEQFVQLKHAECAAFHAQVSDWELQRYAEG